MAVRCFRWSLLLTWWIRFLPASTSMDLASCMWHKDQFTGGFLWDISAMPKWLVFFCVALMAFRWTEIPGNFMCYAASKRAAWRLDIQTCCIGFTNWRRVSCRTCFTKHGNAVNLTDCWNCREIREICGPIFTEFCELSVQTYYSNWFNSAVEGLAVAASALRYSLNQSCIHYRNAVKLCIRQLCGTSAAAGTL